MKAALVGALRREKVAEATIQNLKAEIECMNCLVSMVLTENLVFRFPPFWFLSPAIVLLY